jgi:hypothetical protein
MPNSDDKMVVQTFVNIPLHHKGKTVAIQLFLVWSIGEFTKLLMTV